MTRRYHSHRDEFEIGYADYAKRTEASANAVSFIGGALTPASGNPVFRVYDVDPDTYEIVDFSPIIGASPSSLRRSARTPLTLGPLACSQSVLSDVPRRS